MVKKPNEPVKKVAAPAKKVAAKPSAKKKVSKGDSLACEVCGLSVVVEEVGGVAVAEESVVLCCGKPMKSKVGKSKISKAKAVKK